MPGAATVPAERDEVTVKIRKYALKLLRRLAAHEERNLAETLTDLVLPPLIKKLDKLGIPYPQPDPEPEESPPPRD